MTTEQDCVAAICLCPACNRPMEGRLPKKAREWSNGEKLGRHDVIVMHDTEVFACTSEAAYDAHAFVIPCSCCARPARVLDHLFPYHWEENKCARHLNT